MRAAGRGLKAALPARHQCGLAGRTARYDRGIRTGRPIQGRRLESRAIFVDAETRQPQRARAKGRPERRQASPLHLALVRVIGR